MRFRFFYSFIISFSFLITFSFATPLPQEDEQLPHVTLRVHAVGEGNCVTLEVKNPLTSLSEFMLVDIGSKAFANEAAYRHYQIESISQKEENPNSNQPSSSLHTPMKKKGELIPPESTVKSPDWPIAMEDKKTIIHLKQTYLDKFIEDMRGMLKKTAKPEKKKKSQSKKSTLKKNQQPEQTEISPIAVKTVVITHPDQDHYGWLMELFSQTTDKIDFLIFGGLPSHYYPSDQNTFKRWLRARLDNETKIFFPVIQYEALDPKNPDPLQTFIEMEKNDKFAPHIFSGDPKFSELSFAKAFHFHPQVMISLLAVNPLHSGEPKNVLRHGDDETDDNKDSLVIQVQHGDSSVMLPGDATQATIRCIKRNYKNDPDSLRSTVLLASHHGAIEHGCNSPRLIELVDPKYVVISHGHQHSHPTPEAYENFKLSSRLKQVPAHHVLVGKDAQKKESLHTTTKAIYSTLNSGTITINLSPKEIIFTPEIGQPLGTTEETEEIVKVEEGPNEILLSVRKSHPSNTPESVPLSPIPMPSLEEEIEKVSSIPLISSEEKSTIASRRPKRNVKEKSTVSSVPASGKSAEKNTAKATSSSN